MTTLDRITLVIALLIVIAIIVVLITTQPPQLEVELQGCIDSCIGICEHGSVELGGCLESCVETYNDAVTVTATSP